MKITRKEISESLLNEIDKVFDLEESVTTHNEEKASKTEFGHVIVGDGINVVDGKISIDNTGTSELIIEKFDTPGTYSWTVPIGVTKVYISASGGGGAGGGNRYDGNAASTGGITSFGNILSLSGGAPGEMQSSSTPTSGGLAGGNGGQNGEMGAYGASPGGKGGDTLLGFGSPGFYSPMPNQKGIYGGGGGGFGAGSTSGYRGAGGGGGDSVLDYPIDVISGNTIMITIGAGGTTTSGGANGGDGVMFIKYTK